MPDQRRFPGWHGVCITGVRGARRLSESGNPPPPPRLLTALHFLKPPGNDARGLFFCPLPPVRGFATNARMPQRSPGIATIAVHAGTPEGGNAPLTTPIVQSTTYRFESAAQVQAYQRGEGGLYMYSRDENPTVRAAEEAVARIEGAEAAVLFASGMGAMTTGLLALVSAGDAVIAASALYGGT